MRIISIVPAPPVNVYWLDEELCALSAYVGLQTREADVLVYMEDAAPPDEPERARAIVLAHDAAVLTAQQQKEQDRQARIAAALPKLEAADLRAVANAIDADTTLEPATRAALLALAKTVGYLAHAAGFALTADGEVRS